MLAHMAAKTDTSITGAAGAYFVVAELSQRGWVASPTWGNAPRTDVLAQAADGSSLVSIQVKTRNTGSFQLGSKGEQPSSRDGNEWFILVSLKAPGEFPDFYVVPRDHIVALAYFGYRAWLARPGKNGRPHKQTAMRAIQVEEVERYKDAWGLLNSPAADADWMIPRWVWDVAKTTPDRPARPFKLGRYKPLPV